ncbi:hypothetical protein CEXT_452931 [Caerostris extrusa]|uniref:Uncharacterized protein n=1 Tax=Caerostris extrusa TaxID=172846 RepID=A0AAV4RUB2_CAEEX|nr:hypothetical protein CEXT_452931 [Caerostris extrusa]
MPSAETLSIPDCIGYGIEPQCHSPLIPANATWLSLRGRKLSPYVLAVNQAASDDCPLKPRRMDGLACRSLETLSIRDCMSKSGPQYHSPLISANATARHTGERIVTPCISGQPSGF